MKMTNFKSNRKDNSMKTLIICALISFSFAAFADSNFYQSGYFKDGAKNRIFTILIMGENVESDILSFARDRPNTSGQITAVYFYPKGSAIPADGITQAESVFRANDMLYVMDGLSKWQYAYMKNMNGSETFANCLSNPTHDLCRKK